MTWHLYWEQEVSRTVLSE